ncbi:hypothetical protein V757_06085 [Pelistega indica]|uniref:Periplasmic protein n=1 Tax=Pelistega indica TaxID=1414851 RepID=V8G8V9_9BURK|nr:hypothetical protein [Pelistega indica]ETD72127.1 hypothetical protein V757_06085 [Pelistega indica]
MKLKSIALLASAFIGSTGIAAANQAQQGCGASTGTKAEAKKDHSCGASSKKETNAMPEKKESILRCWFLRKKREKILMII